MQAAEPCPQEEPLKEVLQTLGLPESELEDLHNMGAVKWRLFCGVATLLIVFAVVVGGGVAVSHFWWEDAKIETGEFFRHNKTCNRNLSAETTSVGPSTTSGGSLNHRGRTAKWWRSICLGVVWSPAP